MLGDLSILWSAIKEMHPAYGMYTPPDSLQKVYDQVVRSINVPCQKKNLSVRFTLLLGKLGCGIPN